MERYAWKKAAVVIKNSCVKKAFNAMPLYQDLYFLQSYQIKIF